MKTYILQSIERLKQFSQTLDVKAILCSRAWYVLNEQGEVDSLIFQGDETLLVSTNGDTKIHEWKYIPQKKALHIKYAESKGILLRPFMEGNVLVLQKEGSHEYMFLIDDSLDKNIKNNSLEYVKKYLVNYEKQILEEEQRWLQLQVLEENAKIQREQEEQRKKEQEINALHSTILSYEKDVKRYKRQINQIRKSEIGMLINLIEQNDKKILRQVTTINICFITANTLLLCIDLKFLALYSDVLVIVYVQVCILVLLTILVPYFIWSILSKNIRKRIYVYLCSNTYKSQSNFIVNDLGMKFNFKQYCSLIEPMRIRLSELVEAIYDSNRKIKELHRKLSMIETKQKAHLFFLPQP